MLFIFSKGDDPKDVCVSTGGTWTAHSLSSWNFEKPCDGNAFPQALMNITCTAAAAAAI